MKAIISIFFILIGSVIFSQDSISEYYEEVTTGSELSQSENRCRFYKDVKIYVSGEKNDTLISELHKIVGELNDLIESVNIEIVTDSTKSNINVYFGSEEYFCSVRPGKLVQDLASYAQGFAITYPYYNILNGSLVFINTRRIDNMVRKRHVLREELTQALGFCHDSYKYPTSIFYENFSTVTEYSELDKLVIARHYSK